MPEPSIFLPHQLQPCHPNYCPLLTTGPSFLFDPLTDPCTHIKDSLKMEVRSCHPSLHVSSHFIPNRSPSPHKIMRPSLTLGFTASCLDLQLFCPSKTIHPTSIFIKKHFQLYIVSYFQFYRILSSPFASNRVRDSCP